LSTFSLLLFGILNLLWFPCIERHEVRDDSQNFPFNYFKILKWAELFKLYCLKCTNSRSVIDNRTQEITVDVSVIQKRSTLDWCRMLKDGEDLILVLQTKWTLISKCLLPLKKPSSYSTNHITFYLSLSLFSSLFFFLISAFSNTHTLSFSSCLCVWILCDFDCFLWWN
jgi:hypothetical protein